MWSNPREEKATKDEYVYCELWKEIQKAVSSLQAKEWVLRSKSSKELIFKIRNAIFKKRNTMFKPLLGIR